VVIIDVHLGDFSKGDPLYSRIHVYDSGYCTDSSKAGVRFGYVNWNRINGEPVWIAERPPKVYDLYPEARRGFVPEWVEQIYDNVQWE
jgi:hypothetical protein